MLATSSSIAEGQPSHADTLLKRLYNWGSSFGESRATIRAKMGTPASVKTSTSANRYTPTTDTVTLMTYPGLDFLLTRAGTDGREFLMDVGVTAGQVELPVDVRIGKTTHTSLVGLLGPAKSEQAFGDTVVAGFAIPGDETGEVIQFYFRADTLRKVRWVFYVD